MHLHGTRRHLELRRAPWCVDKQRPTRAGFAQQGERGSGSGQDEYSDDEDPGYWREAVRRQGAFVLTELDRSDDEHSPGRSAFGYHRCGCLPGTACRELTLLCSVWRCAGVDRR